MQRSPCTSLSLGILLVAVGCVAADGGQPAGSAEAGVAVAVQDGGTSLISDAGVPAESGDAGVGSGEDAGSVGTSDGAVTLRVMSLNVFGHATMPAAAPTYAALIEAADVDVIGIQEGVQDWQLDEAMPTDYSRAEALGAALGECYQREYQVFVNTCRGNRFVDHQRFDLTDGPNATRTGEVATVVKEGMAFAFVDVHWDHESEEANAANASETAAQVNRLGSMPIVVLGDFNASCHAGNPEAMRGAASLALIVDGGIDCIFSMHAPGAGMEVDAEPSDHDAVVAELTIARERMPVRR
jgi:endonuclease/exonuclease/phosphatase family metal-dependent hydrolase